MTPSIFAPAHASRGIGNELALRLRLIWDALSVFWAQRGAHHQGDRRAGHGGRRLHRGRAAGSTAESGHDPLRPQCAGAVGDYLDDHRRARLFRPQRSAGAADDAHRPQHAALQPEPRGRQPHHRAHAAPRRDRHRRARARPHARRAGADPASEEPARRAGSRGQQDQSRSAQHAGQRPADLGPAQQPARSGGAALRAEADRLARPRHHACRQHAQIRPRRGGAAPARADALASAGGGGRRRAWAAARGRHRLDDRHGRRAARGCRSRPAVPRLEQSHAATPCRPSSSRSNVGGPHPGRRRCATASGSQSR